LDRPRALVTRVNQLDGSARELTQVDVRSLGKDEAWLRNHIFEHPDVLPVKDISGQFWPLIPLGTEIDQIDALFMSPGGFLTIVETKLVDNPEARRAVLAQVIDYARNAATWSTEDLARKVFSWAGRNKREGRPSMKGSTTTDLYNYVVDYMADASRHMTVVDDEAAIEPRIDPNPRQFLTEVQRNLSHARFLILVVGERDLARTHDLAESIQHSFTFLQFTLAIVELTAYRTGRAEAPDEVLLVPRVVLRTNEIRRSVARLEIRGDIAVTYPGPSEVAALKQQTDDRRARPVSDDDFLDHLANANQDDSVAPVRELIDYLRNEQRLVLRPTSTGISVRLPDPRNPSQLMTLFWLDLKGINFYYLRLHLKKANLPEFLADEFYSSVNDAFQMGLHSRDPRMGEAKEVAAPYPNIVPFSKLPAGLARFCQAVSRVVTAVQASTTEKDDSAAGLEPS